MAGRTNDAAGDGTTTATVLAREMIRFGLQVGWQSFAAKSVIAAKLVIVARFQPAWQCCCCWALYPLPIACLRCLRLLQNVTAGANPISIKRGIDKTCEYLVRQAAVFLQTSVLVCVGACNHPGVPGGRLLCAFPLPAHLPHLHFANLPQVGKLKKHARPVKGSSEIKSVAAISAGNDDEIGQMIADALDKVRTLCTVCLAMDAWLLMVLKALVCCSRSRSHGHGTGILHAAGKCGRPCLVGVADPHCCPVRCRWALTAC